MTGTALRPAQRAAAVAPFHVMRILERARALEAAGRDLIHMEVGEPDFGTPPLVLAAARRAMDTQSMGYTPAPGLPALRSAIAGYYRARYGIDLDPARVLVTPGGSGALQIALAALLDQGQGVLTTDPGYPCNRQIIAMLGGETDAVPLAVEHGYKPTLAQLERAWQRHTRALLLATPANPTGAVMTADELAAAHALARSRGGALVVDEIYQGLVYDVADHTALACGTDDVFVINSFSKYFGMTGWRLGWLVVPMQFVPVVQRLAQNLYLAAPTPSQHAALAAFERETLALLEQRRETLQARRDLLLRGLRALGFSVPYTPCGAFYIYATFGDEEDAASLCERLLEQAGVAVTPGLDFGLHQASRMLRFAYTTDVSRLQQALERIRSVI